MAFVKCVKIAAAVALVAVLSFFIILWNMRTEPIHITPYMVEMQSKHDLVPRRQWMPLDSISPEAIKAVIVCEDNNFFFHPGFDLQAIEEALEHNKHSRRKHGASTITQQMVKNVFLSHERTWARKAAELGLSVLVELMWGKGRIMEVYLNVIETGKGIYGIEAAARFYFNKHAIDLTRREAMLIAIALPNPKKFNPAKPSRYMLARLEQMYEMQDKLMRDGWYKNVTDIKQIKMNYLETYPSPSRRSVAPKSEEQSGQPEVQNIPDIEEDTVETEEAADGDLTEEDAEEDDGGV